MEGQVNIYFILSTTLFVALVIYLIFNILDIYPIYIDSSQEDILYNKAFLVSEFLVKDSGYPKNWNENNFERIGLAIEPFLLSSTKINEFLKICNSTNITKLHKMKESLSIIESLTIEINYINGTEIGYCSLGGLKIGKEGFIRRVAYLGNNFVEVIVHVG